jgi:hypothetical protein
MEGEAAPRPLELAGSSELYKLLYGNVNIYALNDKEIDAYNRERNISFERGDPVFFANFGHNGEYESFEYYILGEYVGNITYSKSEGCEVMHNGKTVKSGISLQEAIEYISKQRA